MDLLSDFFSSPFDQPVGATADLKELEYISALLQTGKVLRSDGSLTAEDVAHYLLSRHGIRVTPECVNNTIFQVFGVDDEAEGELLDLVELTAILVIPILLIMRKEIIIEEDESTTTLKTTQQQQQQQEVLLKEPKVILRNVLSMMFKDSGIPLTPGEDAPRLTDELIQEILRSYGMHFLAEDGSFINQMLSAAQGQTSVGNCNLDEVAFIRALTSDVQMFKNDSLNADDVLLSKILPPKQICKDRAKKKEGDKFSLTEDVEAGKCKSSNVPWQKVFTAPPIDFTADSYISLFFVLCLWVCFLQLFIAYIWLGITSVCHSDSAGCRIANSVVTWLCIAATLMISGFLFIGVGSAGLFQASKPFISTLLGFLGMASVGVCTVFTFFYSMDMPYFSTIYYGALGQKLLYVVARYITLCLGSLLILQQILHLISTRYEVLRSFIESLYIAEKNISQASVYKLARMVQNAQVLHCTWKSEKEMGGSHTCFGRALLHFSKQSQNSEKFSLVRVWSHVFNGKVFREEGIWLSSRLMSGVFIQLVAVCTICIIVPPQVQELLMEFNKPSQNCTFYGPSYHLSNCTFDSLGACYANCTNDPGTIWLEKSLCRLTCNQVCDPCSPMLFPLWACKFALIASLVITGVSLCIQAFNYIPSYVKTTLKFRTGVHPSLGNPYFEDYRIQASMVGNLFGAMFYGVLAPGVYIALLIFFVILFFVAPVFRDTVITILIAVAGFSINVAIKACLMVLFRLRCFASFYRRHPAIANIVGLMFECWSIALAVGFVTLRALKLVFTSLFYIGRIDVPMLQIYGRVRPWKVDFLPMIFRADILAHEAHRHPYIETIGLIYLHKLRCQDFANMAGSTWRVLFVMSLFPWLRRYSFRRKYIEPEHK